MKQEETIISSPRVLYQEVDRSHTYQEVWDWQKHLQKRLIADKRAEVTPRDNYLLLCEHAPVYTLGKSGDIGHLRMTSAQLGSADIEFFKINRGGDITYHGPGQITGYPILDMDQFYHDLHRYVRDIEEVIIRTIADYGLVGGRINEFTGVWLDIESPQKRKICAIGVHMSRWVSMHGFALNVNTDLRYFNNIVPCGIVDPDKSVTSIAQELGRDVDVAEVRDRICHHFEEVFGAKIVK